MTDKYLGNTPNGKITYEVTCLACGKEMPYYEPKMCCSGYECGCRGEPTEPPVCSEACYKKLYTCNFDDCPEMVDD